MANPAVGKDYLFYVNATTEPATPDEITNYTLVGLVRNVNFTDSGESIQSSNKDNGSRTTTFAGNQSYNLAVDGEWGHDDDAGQDAIWDGVKTTTSANKVLYWLLTSDTTSDIQIRGSARALEFSLDTPNDDIMTFSASLEGIGDYTKEAVDA